METAGKKLDTLFLSRVLFLIIPKNQQSVLDYREIIPQAQAGKG